MCSPSKTDRKKCYNFLFFKAEIEVLIKIFPGKQVHYCKVWTPFFLIVVRTSCTEASSVAPVTEEV